MEAAAAEGVRRVVLTSSVAGIGPRRGRPATEDDVYRGGGLGLTYPDAKHEGESEALAAGGAARGRGGGGQPLLRPSAPPVDRSLPGETSTRMIGNYLRGRLPAVVDGETNIVDVRGRRQGPPAGRRARRPGERYMLGGHDIRWVELIERVAELSGVRHPLLVLPPRRAAVRPARQAAAADAVAEGIALMAPELALLLAQGAARARLPGAAARPDAARDDRLVPRADRGRRRRRAASADVAGGGLGLRAAGRRGLRGLARRLGAGGGRGLVARP